MSTIYDSYRSYELSDEPALPATDTTPWSFGVLKPLVKTNKSFVAGGYFKDLFGTPTKDPRDIDVYFYNPDAYEVMLQQFYSSSIYRHVRTSQNATTFLHVPSGRNIDLVNSIFGTPMDVLDSFDFTVTKCAMVQTVGHFHLLAHPRCIYDIQHKILDTTHNITIDSNKLFNRMVKYMMYGYKPSLDLKQQLFGQIMVEKPQNVTPVVTEY